MTTVLIVEDEAFTIEILSAILKRRGHDVLVANNGAEGVANARKNKPDLVIMDMSMPGMNGWEAIRQLKGAADTKAIPIIALTSMTTAEDRDEAYSAGCDAYEAKPIDVQRLEERIKELIG